MPSTFPLGLGSKVPKLLNSFIVCILETIILVCCIVIVWAITFKLNRFLFGFLEHSPRANWIFLPAGLRLIVVLAWRKVGALGLALGAYLTAVGTADGDKVHEILLSLTSGLAPLLAVEAGGRYLAIPSSLAGLRAPHIIFLAVACAAANAIILNGYLWITGHLHTGMTHIAAIFVGDFAGAAIVLSLLSFVLALAIPRNVK